MRISVPGNCERGFSLIEMLVVLVIIGIAAGMIGISAVSAPDRRLHEDAQRLTEAFTVAQSEARSDGRPITWSASPSGWRFQRPGRRADSTTGTDQDDAPLPDDNFDNDTALRARPWQAAPVNVAPEGRAGRQTFSTEWVAQPMQLSLGSGGQTVTITRDAGGNYDIR